MTFAPHEVPRRKIGSTSGYDVHAVAIHGGTVAACFADVLTLLAWPSLEPIAKVKDAGYGAVFSWSGEIVFARGRERLVTIDPTDGRVTATLAAQGMRTPLLALAGGGLLAGSAILDARGVERARLADGPRHVQRAAVSGDGALIAVRDQGEVTIHDAASGAQIAKIADVARIPGDVAFVGDALALTMDAETLALFRIGAWDAPARRVSAKMPLVIAASESTLVYRDGIQLRVLDASDAIDCPGDASALAISGDGLVAGIGKELVAWSRSGAPSSPRAPLVSIRVQDPRSVTDIDFTRVPWLSKVTRLEAWPGPDHAGVAAFIELLEELTRVAGADPIYDAVYARAAERLGSPGEFPAPTAAAPLVVAWLAQIATRYRALGWTLPPVIETALAIAIDGQFPGGFAKKPGKGPATLLVF